MISIIAVTAPMMTAEMITFFQVILILKKIESNIIKPSKNYVHRRNMSHRRMKNNLLNNSNRLNRYDDLLLLA